MKKYCHKSQKNNHIGLTNILFLFVGSICLLISCSTKKVMEDNNAKFEDINEEYEKVVKIAPAPSIVTPLPSEISQPKKSIEISKRVEMTSRENENKVEAVDTKTGAVEHPKKKVKHAAKKKNLKEKSISVGELESSKAEEEKISSQRLPDIEDTEGFSGRRPEVDPFAEGETVVLTVKYFNVSAGDLSLRVNPFRTVNGNKAYHFSINVKSTKMFSMFYAVDDTAETFVDYENLIPLTYEIHAQESARLKEVRTFFDWKAQRATYWEKIVKKGEDEKKKKISWEIEPYSQNVISAIFYLRNFTLNPGKHLSFRIADEGKNYIFKAEVLRKEKLNTVLGAMKTTVLKINFQQDDQFKPTGENLVWVTDDDKKYIVRIESKVKIGTLIGSLKSITKGHVR